VGQSTHNRTQYRRKTGCRSWVAAEEKKRGLEDQITGRFDTILESFSDVVHIPKSDKMPEQDKAKDFYRVVTARQKTGTHVSVPVPNKIAEELLAVLNGNPKYFF
jgi:hypothetical protein